VARRRNESGGVLIHYDVQPDGRITDVFVLKGSGSEILDVAAVACVYERWRDLPATRHGFKVASRDHHALIRFALVGENPRQITSESPTMLFLIAALLAAASLALVPWIDRRPPQDESSRKPVD
jgi:TonB family protein